MVITLLSKCERVYRSYNATNRVEKLPKATYLRFSTANKNPEIMNVQCYKKDNMKLFVKEHEVQFSLLKQK